MRTLNIQRGLLLMWQEYPWYKKLWYKLLRKELKYNRFRLIWKGRQEKFEGILFSSSQYIERSK